MAWILLIIAGLFEIGWPLGFKLASMHSKYFIWFIGLSILSMGLSGYFLYLAQKSIPIGTAYVIWTGIGAIGTVLLGILFFHDSANIFRLLFLSLILIGIVGDFYDLSLDTHVLCGNQSVLCELKTGWDPADPDCSREPLFIQCAKGIY